MKAYVLKSYGGPDVASISDIAVPECGANDVLVKVAAAGLNPVDFKIRQGKLKAINRLSFPHILGNEAAGTVSAVGKNVANFKVGDEVYFRCEKNRMGAFAEYVAVDQSVVAPMPEGLDFTSAAAVPLAALTALQILRDELRVAPGMRILITGGAGGVGTFAIQLAKLMGAHVITTASENGAALVKSLGADQIIDYRNEDFSLLLKDLDGVFDLIGGDTLHKCFRVVKKGGMVVSISGPPEPVTAAKDLEKGFVLQSLFWLISRKERALARAHGAKYRYYFMHPSGDDLRYLAGLLSAKKLKVIIDRALPFAEIDKAFAYLESGRAKGKVVVRF